MKFLRLVRNIYFFNNNLSIDEAPRIFVLNVKTIQYESFIIAARETYGLCKGGCPKKEEVCVDGQCTSRKDYINTF